MRGDPATFLNSGMFKGPSELRRSEGVLGAAPIRVSVLRAPSSQSKSSFVGLFASQEPAKSPADN